MITFRQFGQLLLVVLMICIAMLIGFGIARLLDRSSNVARTSQLTLQEPVATAIATPDDQRRRSVLGSSDNDPAPTPTTPTMPTPPTGPDVTLILPPTRDDTLDQEVGERFVDDTFESTAGGWIDRRDDTWSAQYVDGGYRLALDGQPNLNVALPAPTADFRLSADLTITQGEAGIVFLAQKPTTFYRIMLSADGQYALQVQQGNEVRTVVDWTPSEVVSQSPGTMIRLRIERVDRQVRFWADDQPLTEWTIPHGEFLSYYGFAIASPEQQAEATFDNLVGEVLQSPNVGATGG